MRVAFFGTPAFAAETLRALLLSGRHEVVVVVSQPDRRQGRGNRLVSPPVAALAKEHGLPLLQPASVKTRALREEVRALAPDIGVVVAFGHILGPRLLAVPRLGCLNGHASLLPRWRGAGPIQAALLAGDGQSGVCIMQMDEGLDTGPWLRRSVVAIAADETGASLHDRLAALTAIDMVEVLDALEEGPLPATPQPEEGVSYAPMLRRSDADLDWRRPAEELERRIRALHPWPGTRGQYEGTWIKVHPPAEVVRDGIAGAPPPGTVLYAAPDGIVVGAGEGSALRLHRLQAPGRRALEAGPFLQGYGLAPGVRWSTEG